MGELVFPLLAGIAFIILLLNEFFFVNTYFLFLNDVVELGRKTMNIKYDVIFFEKQDLIKTEFGVSSFSMKSKTGNIGPVFAKYKAAFFLRRGLIRKIIFSTNDEAFYDWIKQHFSDVKMKEW